MHSGGWSPEEVRKLNCEFESQPPKALLEWAVKTFGNDLALVSGFGAEDVALIDMLCKATPRPRVFFIDTQRLDTETYEFLDNLRKRYDMAAEIYAPDPAHALKMIRQNGHNLFYRSVELRMLCCQVRKFEPLQRALSGLRAWISPQIKGPERPENGEPRQPVMVEIDAAHGGILKANPLAGWTQEQVWRYITENGLPHNPLHDRQYRVIDCAPCSRPLLPDEPARAARWWWEADQNGSYKAGLGPQLLASGIWD